MSKELNDPIGITYSDFVRFYQLVDKDEKDKQIGEMTSVIRDRLKAIDSRFINHSEASHYINDIIRACNTLEGKPNK